MVSSRLCLSWKDHFQTSLENNFLVDCTIAADGQRLKAHRLILSACSPYFQMLFGEESEKHPIVFLKDVSFDTLKAIVDFIYHGETDISEGQLDAFLALASSLQIKGLNYSKNNRKPMSSETAGNFPHCSSNDTEDIYDVPSTSASLEDSHNNIALENDGYQINVFCDPSSNSSPFDECSGTLNMEVKPPVIQLPQQQTPVLSDESAFDAVKSTEPEPIHEVILVPKQEEVDEVENDKFVQEIFEDDSNTPEGTAPACGEHLNQFSGIAASCSESGSLVSGAFSSPPMVPPNTQGLVMTETAAQAVWQPDVPAQPRLVKGERRAHTCRHCSKTFPWASHLQIHLRVHTGERPFKCGVCRAAFTTKSNLKVHVFTHERPLLLSPLPAHKRHSLSQTVGRPFKCGVCGACFIQRGDLLKHTHTD